MSYRALPLLSVALVSVGLLVGGPQLAGAATVGASATQSRSASSGAVAGNNAGRLILAEENNAAQNKPENDTYGCSEPNQLEPCKGGQAQTTNPNGKANAQSSYGCDTPPPTEKGSSRSGTTQAGRTDVSPERAHQTSGCSTPSQQ